MRSGIGPERVNGATVDFSLLTMFILLLGVGLAILFSVSYPSGLNKFDDPFFFLKSQAKALIPGIIAIFILIKMSEKQLRKFIPITLIACLVLSILPLLPVVGTELQGVRRWIDIFGFSLQPSELLKVAIILYLAHMLDKKKDAIDDPLNTLLPLFLVLVVSAGIVIAQKDFSTAFFIFAIGLTIFFLAEVPLFYILGILFLFGSLIAIFIFSSEYRFFRVLGFLKPEVDPEGINYQVLAAKSALVDGGFWGSGIGQGVHKMGSVPYAESDFIAAIIGEEFGFIGILGLIGTYISFTIRSIQISLRSHNNFYTLMGVGFASAILLQALINIAVVPGLIPTTGIPLPFFSAGGSSLLASCIMVGLVLHLSVRGVKNSG